MKLKSIATALAITYVSACTVGPDYVKPDIAVPETLQAQEVLTNQSDTPDNPSLQSNWWEGFSDPLLNTLVELGTTQNPTINAAAADIKVATAELAKAQANFRPKADIDIDPSYAYRYSRRNIPSLRDGRFGSAELDASVPLDLFGIQKRQLEAAQANIIDAQATYTQTVQQIRTDIVTAYLKLAGDLRQLTLLNNALKLQAKTFNAVQDRYKKGLATELDLRKAEASFEAKKADVPPLKHKIFKGYNHIATLIGDFPGDTVLANDQPITQPSYQAALPDLTTLEILAARPDVVKAEAGLQKAVAKIGLAKAAYYPSIKLKGSYDLTSSVATGASTIDLIVATIATAIDQTILSGGALEAGVELAKAKADAALADYENTLHLAVENVEAHLSSVRASNNKLQALENSFHASDSGFTQAQILYQDGKITFLNLADAQKRRDSAEQKLAKEQTTHAVLIALLFEALGL